MKQDCVLFVDDEEELQLVMKLLLKNEIKENKFKFECFNNGQYCLDYLKENQDAINVIVLISDLSMPMMDGFELLGHVKKSYPKMRVMIASGFDDKSVKEKALRLGAYSFVEKPINYIQLKKDILKLLNPSK